jgi:hypothetical protein
MIGDGGTAYQKVLSSVNQTATNGITPNPNPTPLLILGTIFGPAAQLLHNLVTSTHQTPAQDHLFLMWNLFCVHIICC